jgi:uncharacterized protein
MSSRLRNLVCAVDPRGSETALLQLLEGAARHRADAIALVGDLGADGDTASLRSVFGMLGRTSLPAFWVPGPSDAPVERYLREARNTEVVFGFLHGVHATVAFGPEHMLFAGFGGEISDDLDAPREERERLRYPRWEPEYRLKLLRELDEHQLAVLLATPPAHKGQDTPGSEAVTELIGTYRPRVAVCGGEPGIRMIGRSLVVAPGSMAEGAYAIVDPHAQDARIEQLEPVTS